MEGAICWQKMGKMQVKGMELLKVAIAGLSTRKNEK